MDTTASTSNFGQVDSAFIAALREQLGARVVTSLAVREQHGSDESYHQGQAPDAVVYAKSTAEVVVVVRLCAQRRVPIVAYGAGTSLEGQVAAVCGGVCINLSQMDKLLALHEADMDAVVEAGISREALNRQLRQSGLFFPVDPGANATLGGTDAQRRPKLLPPAGDQG